jgi:D-alanyl-D-alanine carboxypeptidase
MLSKLHQELGIPSDYGDENSLPRFTEATELVDVGPNLVGRMQTLTPEAAHQFQEMVEAATADGITLMIVSGYRSFDYQAALIRKKLEAGQRVMEILTVNAAPGFSEHHSGRAVDIASPGSRPLTEEFETSDAFDWLVKRAKEFDFSLTYPRENRYGFIYEPWHWSINS